MVNINVDQPWIETTTQPNITIVQTEASGLGDAYIICNSPNIYNAIHYVGFSITTVNGLGYFMGGFRLALPYMFKQPLWPNVYKPLMVAVFSVVVCQPLIMFCWTLCFRENLHERDQLAVILASALQGSHKNWK